MVATWKSESKLSEAKDLRSEEDEIETGEGNSMLAALTEQMAYLMAVLDIKNSSPSNQRNKEVQQNRGNGLGNQGPGNNNRNGAH